MLHIQLADEPASNLITDGDLVVVYERFDSLKAVRVDRRQIFNNKFGHFAMQAQAPSSGWIYLLKPTPELWTRVLPHRTQILYAADISLICTFLELRSGVTVLECGTGSGSLTHALARAVAPAGHVHTFEFHEQRAAVANEEFADHGLGTVVTTTQRNIEESGFPDSLHGQADAVFLDIPGPWKAVPSAAQCLKPNANLATFSPCIEQVQKTRAAMATCGFWDVRVLECLLREHEVRRERMISDLNASAAEHHTGAARKRKYSTNLPEESTEVDDAVTTCVVSRPVMEARGHTGYLVFARQAVSKQSTAPAAGVLPTLHTEDAASAGPDQQAAAFPLENG